MPLSPCLWFETEAEQAAELYTRVIPRSRVRSTVRAPEGGPAPAGSVLLVDVEIDGSAVQLLNGRLELPFTAALSLVVTVDTQDELDQVWAGLTADGGVPGRCGWLTDRFGVSWQVVPTVLGEIAVDPQRYVRAMAAVLRMTKLDIAAIEAAADGVAPA